MCGLDYPSHWLEWEKELDANDRLLQLASRDHAKTTFFSNLNPILQMAKQPGYGVGLISYSEGQVKKIIGDAEDLVDGSQFLQPLKSPHKEDWTKTFMRFSNRSYMEGFGFGTSRRGKHFDEIIVDDPVKDFAGMDPDEQETYFKRAIIPMLKPTGKLRILGTPVYDGDLIDRLLLAGIYPTFQSPAIHPQTGKALWPERWPLEALERRRKEVGDFAFAREYLLQKVDPATQFFKRAELHFWDKLPERMSVEITVDPAISLKGDATGIVAVGSAGEKPDGSGENVRHHVLEAVKMRTDNVKGIVDRVFTMQARWGGHTRIETVGFQRLLKHHFYDEMRRRGKHFGIIEVPSYNKSKEARIMALQPYTQAGTVLFGRDQNDLIEELLIFPNGAHDDLADALSMHVGNWTTPSAIKPKAPPKSFDWWAAKVDQAQDPGNYRSQLFADLG